MAVTQKFAGLDDLDTSPTEESIEIVVGDANYTKGANHELTEVAVADESQKLIKDSSDNNKELKSNGTHSGHVDA